MSSPGAIWKRLRPRSRLSAAFGIRYVFICAAKTQLAKRIIKLRIERKVYANSAIKDGFLMVLGQ